jgi:hypothetical protein
MAGAREHFWGLVPRHRGLEPRTATRLRIVFVCALAGACDPGSFDALGQSARASTDPDVDGAREDVDASDSEPGGASDSGTAAHGGAGAGGVAGAGAGGAGDSTAGTAAAANTSGSGVPGSAVAGASGASASAGSSAAGASGSAAGDGAGVAGASGRSAVAGSSATAGASGAPGAGMGEAGASGSAGSGGQAGMTANVPSDALLWLRTDSGVTRGSDGAVTLWADQSGNQHDASPPTPASAPVWVEQAPHPMLDFTGGSELQLPELPALSQLSIFVVAIARDDGSPRCPSLLHMSNLNGGPTVQADDVELGRHEGELYYEATRPTLTADAAHVGSFTTRVPHVLAVVHALDEVAQLRIDGIEIGRAALALPRSIARTHNFIGNNHYYLDQNTTQCDPFVGRIGEILLYARAVSESERAAIEGYLSAKWGVPLQ